MKKLFLICFVFVIAGFQPVSNAVERCAICQKELTGQYYTFESDNETLKICKECVTNLGKCKLCGVPVKYTNKNTPDVLCQKCRLKAKRCSVCGDLLLGTYFSDKTNHYYCKKCYDNADRCAMCDNILRPGEWSYHNGQKVCNTCIRERPRCHVCGQIIAGRYSVYTGFKGKYCLDCVHNTPTCISCMCPCGPDPVVLPNGNKLCRDCAASAIITKHQLEPIVKEVAGYLDRNLMIRINTPIDFMMVDVVDYMNASDQYRESGRFIRFNNDFTIKILAGLSRALCIETVAHELAHAWQAENCPFLPSDELVEGFAQWVAGKTLEGFGYNELTKRLDSREDVYGRGYKLLVKMEETRGFAGVFRKLKELGNPPE